MFESSGGAGSAQGPGPLADSPAVAARVSVLVRSMGRATLDDALASVAAQALRPFEVVVVNASGRPHTSLPPAADGLPCRIVDPGRPLGRAAAANAALEAARGEWLLFLDDDDTLGPAHLQRLVDALRQTPDARIAHAGVSIVDAEGRTCGALDEPVDALALWSANRLAIHAVLFSRALVDEGLRFDESFEVYEDWDFWFRIARRERFVHVAGVSAQYRLVGNSGASEAHDTERSHALRLPFYVKWLAQLKPGELEALAASAEHARANHAEALRLLHDSKVAAAEAAQAFARAENRFALALAEAGHARQALEQRLQQQTEITQAVRFELLQTQDEHRRVVEQLTRGLQQALSTYAQLEAGYHAITHSLSWRITRPLRRMRSLAEPQVRSRLARRIWRALPLGNDLRLRIRDSLLTFGWSRRAAGAVLPDLAPAAALPPPPPTDKERVRADAEAGLGEWLAGDQRITLPACSAAPEVSVIVVLFNQAGLSRLCLQALAATVDVDFETLIVDNGSTDRVPQLLDRVDGASVLRPGENLGFLLAVNRAAAQARGRHLVLLNNDALVEPHTLRHAVDRLRRDPGAGAVGGPILLWNGRLQEAGSIIWNDGSCQGYGREDDPARPEYRFVRDVDYCSGAFLMIRRELFESLGRFDEAFAPAYYEESDFCVRLWEAGHRIVYDPQVRIRHFEFASEVASGWAIDLQRRHRELFVQRHGPFLAAQSAPSPVALVRARARLRTGCQRVLVIDDRVPLPWLGQGYPRAAQMTAALAAEGHAVTQYPLQFPRECWDDVSRALPETVEVMLDHGLAALPGFLRARRGLYDSVIVSRPHNMQALRRLLQSDPDLLGGARLVYDAEAMFSLRDIAKAELDGKPLSPEEQRRRIAEELALADGADAVIAVSEAEADHHRAAGRRDVHVLGHALEVVRDTPGFAERADLLFVGALLADDTPNADSVRWFVQQVWPQVAEALGPEVKLHVVGPCEAPSVRALASPRIVLHGAVADLAPFLDRARLFIVPTRYAAGIPHKAHEAAARGLPMMATALIVRQLGWANLLASPSDAVTFGLECRRLYCDSIAWEAQRVRLVEAVIRDCSSIAFRASLERITQFKERPTHRSHR